MSKPNEPTRPPGRDELPAVTSRFSSEQLRRLAMDPPPEEIQKSVVKNDDGTDETYYYVRRAYIIREFNEIFGAGNWNLLVHSETVPLADRALALRTDLKIVIDAGSEASSPLTLSATSERLLSGDALRALQGERSAIEAHALKRVAALLGRRFGLGFYPGGDDPERNNAAPEPDGPDDLDERDDPELDEPDDLDEPAAPETPVRDGPGSPQPREPLPPQPREPLPPQPRTEPIPIEAAQRTEQAAQPRPAAQSAQAATADGLGAPLLPEILGVFSDIAERRGLKRGQGGKLMTDACQRQFGEPPSKLTEEQQEQLLAAAHSERDEPPAA